MAITTLGKIPEESHEETMEDLLDVSERFTESFQVKSTNRRESPRLIKNAPGIPRRLQPHPDNGAAVVQSRNAYREDGSDYLWRVDIEYSTQRFDPDQQDQENPTLRPPTMWGGSVKRQKAAWGDVAHNEMEAAIIRQVDAASQALPPPPANGVHRAIFEIEAQGVVNSAGEPFDPPLMREVTYPIFHIRRAERAFDLKRLETFSNTLNAKVFLGLPRWSVKLQNINFTPIERWRDIPYRWITYEFHVDRERWIHWVLDRGTYHLIFQDGNAVKRENFVTNPGHPRIGLLNGVGEKLGDNQKPVFLGFQLNTIRDFGPLQIPQTLNRQ